MTRQCAWCLRLIDDTGRLLSSEPLAKDYKATHGMCRECGAHWLESVLYSFSDLPTDESDTALEHRLWQHNERHDEYQLSSISGRSET